MLFLLSDASIVIFISIDNELVSDVLISYNKQEKEKLLLRIFVNRLMIFIYKIIIVVSENRRN